MKGQYVDNILFESLVSTTSLESQVQGYILNCKTERLPHANNITCNPHSFRRVFASILLKSGIDRLDIKRLGRWQNPQMVARYARSV
jgi:hypothetical protein